MTPENNEQAVNFSLYPFDVINIVKWRFKKSFMMVTIRGAVNYAGNMFWQIRKRKYICAEREG
jgi:hypothetical protein